MKANEALAIIAAILLTVTVFIVATHRDDLNGYVPGTDYVHSEIKP